MVYGYDAKLDSRSTSLLRDYCLQFIESIKTVRRTRDEKLRPIFIIAHSFGGIIAARTLIQAHNVDQDLYNAIYGFLFFGTPHRDLIMDDIKRMLEDPSHQRNALSDQIDPKTNSDYLRDQSSDFKNVRRGRRVVSFYETHETPSLQKNPATGGWKRSGPLIPVAPKDTYLLQLDDVSEQGVPVDADHSRMVKFESENDPTYEKAVTYLENFEAVAKEEVLSRFECAVALNELTEWLSKLDFRKVENDLRNSQVTETGNAFLESAEFALFEQGKIQLLKCIGDEGSGKTYLASSVSERLHREMQDRNRSVVSLYLGSVDKTPRTEDLLGAILRQMIETLEKSKIPNRVRDLYLTKAPRQRTPTVSDLSELLRARISEYDRVFLIVDGLYHLDKRFEEVRRSFERHVALLRDQTKEKLSIMYFLWDDTSLPEAIVYCDLCKKEADLYFRCEVCKGFVDFALDICPTCEREGRRCNDQSYELTLLSKEPFHLLPSSEDDVRAYVRGVVQKESEIAASLPEHSTFFGQICERDPVLRESLVSEVTEGASGRISVAQRWIAHLKEQVTESTFNEARKSIPCRDDMYEQELQKLKEHRERSKSMGNRVDGLVILGLVAVAARSMNARELQIALAVLEANSTSKMAQMGIHNIRRLTKGLMRIDRDRDAVVGLEDDFELYLTRPEIKTSWMDAAHLDMANACLNYLNSHDFYTDCERIKDHDFIDIPFLSYATSFWGIHVREAGARAETKALRFLQDRNRTQAYIKAAWHYNLREFGVPWDVRRDVSRIHICAYFGLSSLLHKFCVETESLVNDRELTYGQTPLMYACRRRQVSAVRVLLEAGADLNCFSSLGHTALFEAIIHHEGEEPDLRLQIIDLLLEQKGKLRLDGCDYRSKYRTALMVAAAQEHSSEIVRKLLKHGANVNHTANGRQTALMVAVVNGRTENVKAIVEAPKGSDIVELLLDHGADAMLRDASGRSALLKAVEKGILSVVEAMLRPGLKSRIDLACRDRNGRGLLHGASKGGNAQVIHLLSRCGLRSDLPDDRGRTPLHEAAKHGKMDAVTVLISELRADKSQRDRFGRIPSDVAAHYGHSGLFHLLSSQATALSVSKEDRDEGNELHRAVFSSSVNQLADLLESHSVSPNERDRDGRTPLHLAIYELNIKAVILLIPHTDLTIKDCWGFTPMDIAVQRQVTDRTRASMIALALIGAGASFKRDDFDDLSKALYDAVRFKQADAANALLNTGADIRHLNDVDRRTALQLARESTPEMRVSSRISWTYDPQIDAIPQPTELWFFW